MRTIVLNKDIIHELWNHYIQYIHLSYIKNRLTVDMDEEDMIYFISELHSRYKLLKKEFEENILNEIKNYSNIDISNKYFIDIYYHKYYNDYLKIIELEKFLKTLEAKVFVHSINFKGQSNESYKFDINSLSITDVIGRYIKLPDNLQKNIKCPFKNHNDKNPSFHIFHKSNSFFCFGCGKGTNAINFIAEMENVSNKEAFAILKNLYFN